jgi:transcriptional regulator
VENIKDKVRKGRQPRGTQFAHAKLTEAKVAELLVLRAEGWSGPDLARRYGVTRENIASIVKGKTWGHVEGPRESPPSHE